MRRTRAHEDGATAVEYGLIIALIAAVIIIAVTTLGVSVDDWLDRPCQERAAAGVPC
jgi:pilus assembly protein Flp/PilA